MTDPVSSAADGGSHEGGCLCGDIRFRTTARPLQTVICHCTFCQRLTGGAFLVEPMFRKEHVTITGVPQVFERVSDGSGKTVGVNFCGRCGTTLFLTLERFPTVLGLCGGAFDDPNWFDRGPGAGRHIFTCEAQAGVAVPPGVDVYAEHAIQLDGTPNAPRVFATATVLRG